MDPTQPSSGVPQARNIGDLAAALPTILGFRPENSLVALCMDPDTNQLAVGMRLDIPDKYADMIGAAGSIGDHINRHAPLRVILFAVTPNEKAGREVIDLVEASIGSTSLIGAARVDAGRYWDLLHPHPVEGRPLRPTAFTEQLTARNVLNGRRVFDSRTDLEAAYAPASNAVQRQTAKAIMSAAKEVRATRDERGEPVAIAVLRQRALAELNGLIEEPRSFNITKAGWLTVASGFPPVRDDLRRQITRANAGEHAEAWRMIATHAPGTTAASPYALSAFANWLSGDGAQASAAVQQALRCNPDHNLAKITDLALTNGVDPKSWAKLVGER